MARRKRPWTFVPAMAFLSTGLVTLAGAVSYRAAAAQPGDPIGVIVMPGAVAKRAMMAPSPNSTKTTSAGKNNLEVSIAHGMTTRDLEWTEPLDIDGDGEVEETTLVWDAADRVLYAFSRGTFRCQSGPTAVVDLLVAANGPDNRRNRPVGSGFWVADLGKDECGAESAGLWGCKFDGGGDATECGAGRIDAKNDDLIILTATH
jgi:hypothetical protein